MSIKEENEIADGSSKTSWNCVVAIPSCNMGLSITCFGQQQTIAYIFYTESYLSVICGLILWILQNNSSREFPETHNNISKVFVGQRTVFLVLVIRQHFLSCVAYSEVLRNCFESCRQLTINELLRVIKKSWVREWVRLSFFRLTKASHFQTHIYFK